MATYNTLDSSQLKREDLLNNDDFINDASQFLADREDYYSDDVEDIYDRYLEHFRYQNVNEVTAARDMYHAQNLQKEGDQDGLDRMNRLMSTFEKQDSEFTTETATDYLGGIFTAPSTYVGALSFGAGKAGAAAAQQGIKFGIKQILKEGSKKAGTKLTNEASVEGAKILSKTKARQRWKDSFVGGGYKTAIGAGVADTGGAFATAAYQEQTRVETDIKDEFSYGQVGLITALSAVAGTGVGAFIGSQKAMTSNIAERFAMVEHKKLDKIINDVYQTKTLSNIAKGGSVASTQRKVRNKLKLSLKETDEDLLKVGKALKVDLKGKASNLSKNPNAVVSMSDKLIENISMAGAELVHTIGPRLLKKEELDKGLAIFKEKGIKAKGAIDPKDIKDGKIIAGTREDMKERITARVSRGLQRGVDVDNKGFTVDSYMDTLKSFGLNPKQFSALYSAEVSQAGRTLGSAGRISKEASARFMADLTALEKAVFTNGDDASVEATKRLVKAKEDKGSFKNVTGDFVQALNKTRIGLMTIQLATTMRNTTNGGMRGTTYGLDNINTALINIAKGKANQAGWSFSDLTKEELTKVGSDAIKLGKAELRAGGQALKYKDMVLGMQSTDTAILMRIFKDPRLGKSDQALRLLRDLGDIGNITGVDSGKLIGTAKFLNKLNTLSDNMFKSAIFSREIDKIIKTDIDGKFAKIITDTTPKGVDSLNSLLKVRGGAGALRFLKDSDISKAMNNALDFTYQTSDFASKKGGFNSFASWFIDQSSGVFGSAFVPFPRYLINQLRFVHEHAPIFGSLNLGGMSNEAGKAGVKPFFNFESKALGKQLTGAMMLSAFYGMREQFGDENTQWFEYKNPFGHGTFNAKASLGPYSALAWTADFLYKRAGPNGYGWHDNDKVVEGKTDWAGLSESLLGGLGRSGTGLMFIEQMGEIIGNVTGEVDEKSEIMFNDTMAKFLGNYLSTFTVGMGLVKDVVASVHPDYRLLTDNTDIEFLPYMFKTATRSFPMEAHADGEGFSKYDFFNRESQTSPSNTGGITNEQPLLRQFIGLTPQREKNISEKEFGRLGITYRQIAPIKLVDPGLNRESKQYVASYVERALNKYIETVTYQNLSNMQKKESLKTQLRIFRGDAIREVLGRKEGDTNKELQRKERALYFKGVPSASRSRVQSIWKELNPGEEFNTVYGDYGDYLDIYNEYVKPQDAEFKRVMYPEK